ncbi:unnamed protein product [Parnassius mnemosyne]|uniref:G-protein coupled receptors family 1 profile domain-containing protein n=1 Tax=Parnassius mnemosyne TaxID=213953 RepID=A0AAV1K4G6_9NEOP
MEGDALTLAFNESWLLRTYVNNSSVSNASNASGAYGWRYITPLYIIVFLLSTLGNCLVIATLISNQKMMNVLNVYILNLTISDFMLGVFCIPFTLIGQIYKQFLFGAALCKLIPFLQAVSVSVDVWTLVAISLERYFAICKPLKSRKWQTQCHAYKMIGIVWVLSLVFNSPIAIVSTLQPMGENRYKCREEWTSLELNIAFTLSSDAFLMLIPFFIMSIAYYLIVTKLWSGMRNEIKHNLKWHKNLTMEESCTREDNHHLEQTQTSKGNTSVLHQYSSSSEKSNEEKEEATEFDKKAETICVHTNLESGHVVRSSHIEKSIKTKRKVIKMLFVVILVFFVCWTPLHIVNTVYLFYPYQLYANIGTKGILMLQLLAFCSSCCNPVIYCFMNKKFMQAFIGLLKSCKLLRRCLPDKREPSKQATPPPSNKHVTTCKVKGSQTGRTELICPEGEKCVQQWFTKYRAEQRHSPGTVGPSHLALGTTS